VKSRQRPLSWLVLLLGIASVSTASIFIRYAQRDAPSLTIAAARLALATLVLAPPALARHRAALARLGRRELGLALLAGMFLALHFALWIASLGRTSVASSVVLVTTTPLWVGLLGPLLLRERLTRPLALGILIAMAGGVAVGWSDAGGRALAARAGSVARAGTIGGDALALGGALMMTGYLLAGRRLRRGLALVPYVFVVYGAAAVVLLAAMTFAGQGFLALPARVWLWLALVALVPQLLGHSSFNWALRYLPASFVAIALLGEPVGSTALAWALLRETPPPLTLFGAVLILAGIAIAATSAPATIAEEPAG